MRRRADLRWRLQGTDFDRMRHLQLEIVRAVIPLLKPKGVLVYSTCSLESEENQQVERLLIENLPRLQLLEEKSSLPFRDGFDGAFAAKFIRTV
jgi:16S rRNA (cytosine967-C5)-methyltransferase